MPVDFKGGFIVVIGVTVLTVVGLFSLVLGLLLWKKQKINLLHDYHRNGVTFENTKAFCTLSGIGVVIIGAGCLVSALLLAITDALWSFIPFILGFIVGLSLLVLAGRKYNKPAK